MIVGDVNIQNELMCNQDLRNIGCQGGRNAIPFRWFRMDLTDDDASPAADQSACTGLSVQMPSLNCG